MNRSINICRKVKNGISLLLVLLLLGTGCNLQNQEVEEGYKSVNGTEIYYKRMGAGEPLVIVHGGPVLEHGYLLPHLKPLSDSYELIFFDQRLSGRSAVDVDSSAVTMQNFTDDIEALRESLNLGKIHLMGHSWGGLLAMKYAVKYPQNLNKVVLSNTMPGSAELWQQEEIELAKRTTSSDRRAREKIRNSERYKSDNPDAIEELLLLSFQNQFHDTTYVDSLNFYIPEDYTKRSLLFGNLMPELQNYDIHSDLARLEVPVLLIYGSDEPATGLSGKKLDETLPNSSLIIMEEAGHFPFIEKSDQFLKTVQKFLREGN